MKQHFRAKLKLTLIYTVLCLICLGTIFPYVWMVMSSLKTRLDIFSIPPAWIFKPTLSNYIIALFEKGFITNFLNTVIIACFATLLSLIVGVPSAYALARWRLFGDHQVFFYVLTTRMAPPITIVVPLYLLYSKVFLLNTHIGIIIAHMTFNLAYVVWIMRGFFEMLPKEIEEAGLVDGCGNIRLFWYIVLPLARGGLIATAILCMIMSWNEFLFAFILGGIKCAPLTVVIPGLVTTYGTFWGQLTAMGSLVTIPILVFSFIIQKHLIRGLTFGAIK